MDAPWTHTKQPTQIEGSGTANAGCEGRGPPPTTHPAGAIRRGILAMGGPAIKAIKRGSSKRKIKSIIKLIYLRWEFYSLGT